MGLTELFNEWIVERGSAKVQEKHIALFRDQLVIADKKISALEKEIKFLKLENEQLESDYEKSKKENEILRAEMQKYEQSHNVIQQDESIRMLTFLAKNFGSSTADIAQALVVENETAKFYLHELEAMKMIIQNLQIDDYGVLCEVWSLAQNGRRFLVQNKIIT